LSVRTFAAIPIIAVALAGCSGSDHTVSPADFVTAHAQDAQPVVAAVQSVDTGIQTAGGDDYALAKLDAVLNDAQSTFDRVNKVLLTSAKPKGVESSDASLLLLGLQTHHGSGLSSGWTLLGALVATQVAAL